MRSRLEIEEELASKVGSLLEEEINQNGSASLLVSGGSTPKGFFSSLSIKDIQWEKVSISLVDERFLPDGCSDQNGTMVKKYLLRNNARKAQFYPMVLNPTDLNANLEEFKSSIKELSKPFTVVVLGMGEDGHTASFFPDSLELKEVMSSNNQERVMTVSTDSSPYPRITFTYQELINAKHLFLHFYGEKKEEILNKAKVEKGFLPYPIQMFVNDPNKSIEIFSNP